MHPFLVRVAVPVVLAGVLTVIGLLHFVWAFTPWPMKDSMTFTKSFCTHPPRTRA